MIQLKEITKENVLEFCLLEVKENQKDQVATNSLSIAEGNYHEEAWFRGVYYNDIPVGFVMLYLDVKNNKYDVWRYMIDKKHQGKGYGKVTLTKVIEFIKTFPDAKEISLSYVPKDNGGADGFYRKFGFIDTGKKEGKELIMKYLINKAPNKT